jgi:hypothetical protein
MDMFSLFNHVKKANEDRITSEYEYLILFIRVYILDEFKLEVRKEFFSGLNISSFRLKKPDKIISMAYAGYHRFETQYEIESRRVDLKFSHRPRSNRTARKRPETAVIIRQTRNVYKNDVKRWSFRSKKRPETAVVIRTDRLR